MKYVRWIPFFSLFFFMSFAQAQENSTIRLIVRADDIGSTHAANLGCMKSYTEGIARSVEIMVPAPWFEEAVQMLHKEPGYDVGIHLVLTSEWNTIKWRPITHAKSITTPEGYFYPFIWPNNALPPGNFLKEAEWNINEIEAEFRAQIELAMGKIPYISHLTCHMGCASWDDQVKAVYEKLAKEYNLSIDPADYGVKRFKGFHNNGTYEERVTEFLTNLKELEPGTYLFVEHPATGGPEMQGISQTVSDDRDMVTRLFTDERILTTIKELNIELINYKALLK